MLKLNEKKMLEDCPCRNEVSAFNPIPLCVITNEDCNDHDDADQVPDDCIARHILWAIEMEANNERNRS
jgi:hypothetical protein